MTDWQDEIAAATARLAGHVRRTPVMTAWIAGREVELKLEHLQYTGAFKARGAFNNLLSRPIPEAGIVAASGGNHGAGVAFAAVRLGYRATIFVPEMAGPSKIGLIERSGADCRVVPGAYADALQAALDFERETGAIQFHAYDGRETVAGQGTIFAEWESQGLAADTVIVAVGGGGLIGGALGWFDGSRKVVAVEPELAPTLARTLQSGPGTEVDVGGVAANALGARTLGRVTWDLVEQYGVHSLTLPDSEITAAQRYLWREFRQLVEPAGAVAVSALLSGAYVPEPGERVAVLICGGNIQPDPLP